MASAATNWATISEALHAPLQAVLAQVHPGMAIRPLAVKWICNQLVARCTGVRLLARLVKEGAGCDEAIADEASPWTEKLAKAISHFVEGELAKHAVSEGTKAVTKHQSNGKDGLVFPFAVLETLLPETATVGDRIFLAAVAEYLSAEILELGGNCQRDAAQKPRRHYKKDYDQVALRNAGKKSADGDEGDMGEDANSDENDEEDDEGDGENEDFFGGHRERELGIRLLDVEMAIKEDDELRGLFVEKLQAAVNTA